MWTLLPIGCEQKCRVTSSLKHLRATVEISALFPCYSNHGVHMMRSKHTGSLSHFMEDNFPGGSPNMCQSLGSTIEMLRLTYYCSLVWSTLIPRGVLGLQAVLTLPKDEEQSRGRSSLKTRCLNWELLEAATFWLMLNFSFHHSHWEGMVFGGSDKTISAKLRKNEYMYLYNWVTMLYTWSNTTL